MNNCQHMAKQGSRLCERCLHYLFDAKVIEEAQGRYRVWVEEEAKRRAEGMRRGRKALVTALAMSVAIGVGR